MSNETFLSNLKKKWRNSVFVIATYHYASEEAGTGRYCGIPTWPKFFGVTVCVDKDCPPLSTSNSMNTNKNFYILLQIRSGHVRIGVND